jgi:subtilisin family serine protease
MLPRLRTLSATFALVWLLASAAWSQSEAPNLDDLLIRNGPLAVSPESRVAVPGSEALVVVQLTERPLASLVADARARGASLSPSEQREHRLRTERGQNELMARVRALGGREVARLSNALVAVAVSIDRSRVDALAALPGVRSVRPALDYKLDLGETVPYIGATSLHGGGFDGTGVTIAVLDSGIDYTHSNLGGPGTAAAYAAAYGASTADPKNTTLDGLFPTAKVVGGFDFVGEQWPDAALAPDPDPIDCGPETIAPPCDGGHGTHVADIAAGRSANGTHKGVAPGASLYAVKVCSAVATSCSGLALLQGVEFSLDPNGDGDISDRVDVINMSLGSSYGQREDDLSEASANAVRVGVVVVASAGNSADRPYITGSPSTTPELISVAQTQTPSAISIPLVVNAPANIAGTYANTATLDWAPIGAGATGDVAFVGRGCPAGSGPPVEDPYLANPAGKVALIDRGACAVSLKVDRAAKAGAIGVLIGLVASGDAQTFAFGGGDMFVPSLVVTQATSNLIKANLAAPVNVTMSPAFGIPLVGSMVASSSRGPSHSFDAIKPDIGAPGASLSAEAGTGTGEVAFGGTSGAAPMVSGSAALLLQAWPALTPNEVKARLMNTADAAILINPATQPGVLAPITRIGGGEVRVNRAATAAFAAWDANAPTSSLSFGYRGIDASGNDASFTRHVEVHNASSQRTTYAITSNFRYADDAASGAVQVTHPSQVTVPAGAMRTFPVRLDIDASKLPIWTLNGGGRGGDGFRLQGVEFDGYVEIRDGSARVHLPWHVLPHRAAAVQVIGGEEVSLTGGTATVELSNAAGSIPGRVDTFALTGTSPRIGTNLLPEPGDNIAVIDLKSVGVRLASPTVIQFAVNTFGERAHPNYPAEFDVFIDANRDGEFDSVIFNFENGGFAATGQNVVAAGPLPNGPFTAFFFTDADLRSANAILTAPLAAVGLTAASQFDFAVGAFDNYFTGVLSDVIDGMTFSLATPRFVGSGIPGTGVPAGGTSSLTISEVPGGSLASPSQKGLLLMYRDGKPRREADTLTVSAE